MDMLFERVKDKYADSLSQFDLHVELTAPEKFWPLNFSEVEDVFRKMVQTIYELEVFDFRNTLFPQEVTKIETSRNFLISKFNEIRAFTTGIGNGTQQTQQNIINEIINHYRNTFFQTDDLLFKVRTKQLLDNPKGKELESVIAESKEQAGLIKKSKEEIDTIKSDLEKTLAEAKKGTAKTGELKAKVGSLEIGRFFEEEAEMHRVNAMGGAESSYKNFFWLFQWWIGSRRLFFMLIFVTIAANIGLYFAKREIFTIEYGVLSISLLLILYMGMSFSTNNYSVEKQLESENRNKSTIASTLELFLSAPQTEESRWIILQNATVTLFSPPSTWTDKGKVQNVSLPITEITKVIKGSDGQ